GREIRIEVEAEGGKIGPQGWRLVESQDGDRVGFELREPHFEFHLGFMRRWVHIEVHVPERASLDVHTGDGNIEANRVRGALRLDSGDGNLDLTSLAGDVHLHTSDGRISA